jgi:hypothetical protein
VPTTVTNGRSLPMSSSPKVARATRSSATDRARGVGAAEVAAEGQVDHAVDLSGAGTEGVQVGEIATSNPEITLSRATA